MALLSSGSYRARRVSGAVCGRTVLYFDSSVDSATKAAVIQSLNAAQAAADGRYDSRRSFAHWYLSLRSRLKDFGWGLHSRPKCTPSRPSRPSSTLDELGHEIEMSEVGFTDEEREGIARVLEAVAGGSGEGYGAAAGGTGKAREEFERGVGGVGAKGGLAMGGEARVFQIVCVRILDAHPAPIIQLKSLTVHLTTPSSRPPPNPLAYTWGPNSGVRFSIWNDMWDCEVGHEGDVAASGMGKGGEGVGFTIRVPG